MSGLLFLTSDDFYLQQGYNGNIMSTTIQGFSLILFYSTMCSHCKDLIPIFKALPGKVGGCQFGMINVSNNKNCIMMSKQTINPLSVVPYIVLHIDGKPYMRYNGPYDIEDLKQFIFDVSNDIRSQQTQPQQQTQTKKTDEIKHYRPNYSDDVCYLDLNEAYQLT